jgi:hypothetical protein
MLVDYLKMDFLVANLKSILVSKLVIQNGEVEINFLDLFEWLGQGIFEVPKNIV